MNQIRFRKTLNFKHKQLVLDLILAVLLGITSIIVSLWVFREGPRAIFSNQIPLAGDGLFTGLYLRLVDQASYLDLFFQNIVSNDFGWPNQLNFSSYPVGNTQEVVIIKLFMDLTGITDPSQIIHIFSILKAAPIAIATFLLFRVLELPRILSFFLSLIFALSTFNLIRAEQHFFLALTWSLPLGFAAIYIVFKQTYEGGPPHKKKIVGALTLGFLSSLSGYYYTFFLIIFSAVIFVFLFLSKYSNSQQESVLKKFKFSISKSLLAILLVAVFILGLMIQTLPVLFRNHSALKLTALADRSLVEAIIYAGTPESLLFDLYSYTLRILHRPDLAAFLQSRISWEGSQVGALSGIVFVCVFAAGLTFGLIQLLGVARPQTRVVNSLSPAVVFVTLILASSLLLYFVSPINFGISRLLPQIRAWGRLSVVITLMSLLLFGIVLTHLVKVRSKLYVALALLLLIPATEVGQFHLNRPPSSALNSATDLDTIQINQSLQEVERLYKENCALVNLPIYPFPEFDRSDDKNIDYGQLRLPLSDSGRFKWSYAGIKATGNFATWQPLVSAFSPFARASINYQIEYANATGACGAIIDRSYLAIEESNELGATIESGRYCIIQLSGAKVEGLPRYVSINFVDKNCRSKPGSDIAKFAKSNMSGKFVWRIDQGGAEKFDAAWQIFPPATAINLRFNVNKTAKNDLYLLIKAQIVAKGIENSAFQACLISVYGKDESCFALKFNSMGIGKVKFPNFLTSGKLEKFTVNLKNKENFNLSGWGVVIQSDN